MAGKHQREVHRARLLERGDVGDERLRARPGEVGVRAQRPREQRVRGDVLDQVVGGEQDRARLVEEHRVRGAVSGAVQHPQRAIAQLAARSPSASGRVTSTAEPQARKLAETARSAVTTSAGMPWRSIIRSAKRSSSSVCSPKLARNGARRSSAATSAPERRARIEARPKWSMCWWLTISSSMSSIAWPRAASACSSSSSALAEFGPGVDQRQRRVLDQVGVDPPDLERASGSPGGGCPPRAATASASSLAAHERISASTSSRRRSMSSRETSDSRHRRSSGSVFEGRTLKCQSS